MPYLHPGTSMMVWSETECEVWNENYAHILNKCGCRFQSPLGLVINPRCKLHNIVLARPKTMDMHLKPLVMISTNTEIPDGQS